MRRNGREERERGESEEEESGERKEVKEAGLRADSSRITLIGSVPSSFYSIFISSISPLLPLHPFVFIPFSSYPSPLTLPIPCFDDTPSYPLLEITCSDGGAQERSVTASDGYICWILCSYSIDLWEYSPKKCCPFQMYQEQNWIKILKSSDAKSQKVRESNRERERERCKGAKKVFETVVKLLFGGAKITFNYFPSFTSFISFSENHFTSWFLESSCPGFPCLVTATILVTAMMAQIDWYRRHKCLIRNFLSENWKLTKWNSKRHLCFCLFPSHSPSVDIESVDTWLRLRYLNHECGRIDSESCDTKPCYQVSLIVLKPLVTLTYIADGVFQYHRSNQLPTRSLGHRFK